MNKDYGDRNQRLNSLDEAIIRAIKERGEMSKTEAGEIGLGVTTFHQHAKKLLQLGILEAKELKITDGKGRTRVVYNIRGEK